ncbi:MAG: hypothetical protein Q9197_003485 [Variospora fuerteventurae]
MALLSIFKSDGEYSSTVASNFDIAFLERLGGIFGDCVVDQGIGGFRQTRTLSSHLPASKRIRSGANDHRRPTVPGEGMIMVLFGNDSPYEKYLLSGSGASHYDAAKQLPGGKFAPAWYGRSRHPESISLRPGRGNLTQLSDSVFNPAQRPSQQLTSSRVRRSSRKLNTSTEQSLLRFFARVSMLSDHCADYEERSPGDEGDEEKNEKAGRAPGILGTAFFERT